MRDGDFAAAAFADTEVRAHMQLLATGERIPTGNRRFFGFTVGRVSHEYAVESDRRVVVAPV